VDRFDTEPDPGQLSGRRRFAEIPADEGCADGLTLDAEGAIWVAVWGSGQVRRYLPDGRLEAVLRLPVSQVTSVAFGGPGLSTLFVTSAREEFSPAQLRAEPHAGDIFCCAADATGRLPFRYAGPA
jgi:sugar lactone lactonase YvrE